MSEIHTENDFRNPNFSEDHSGDEHRQETVFDKGSIAPGLHKGYRAKSQTVNDLSRHRWRSPILDARTERQLIRDAKSGDEAAKLKLVQSFHRYILKIAGQYSGPPFDDLMGASSLGFSEALSRFNENRGCRLSTYAEPWIRKHILEAIKDWRREGAAGETRQDRYIFSNPSATAERVVAKAGGTLADAEGAIARLDASHRSYDTTEASFDEDGKYTGPKPATSHEVCIMYDRYSRFQLSPQLRVFEPASRWIDELANHHIAESKRRLGKVGRRQYAQELVERERILDSYRSKPGRYLYRTDTSLSERTRIAHCGYTALPEAPGQRPQPQFEIGLPQYEIEAQAIRAKNARLKALRPPPKESKSERKRKRKQLWRDTQTTTAKKSFPLQSPPMLPARRGPFVKKSISASATFVEQRYSAI